MPPVGGYQAVQYKVSLSGVVEGLGRAWRVREPQEEGLRRDARVERVSDGSSNMARGGIWDTKFLDMASSTVWIGTPTENTQLDR